jgi:ATP adenylyltransferase
MKRHLFNFSKITYVKNKTLKKSCPLCAIRDRDSDTVNLEVYRSTNFIVSINLFPFNPGHLLIFPKRHIESIKDYNNNEVTEAHDLLLISLEILSSEYGAHGFNLGYNLGKNSGASIDHVHMHVVPRYENEIGLLEVLSDTKPIIRDPVEMRDLLIKKFAQK